MMEITVLRMAVLENLQLLYRTETWLWQPSFIMIIACPLNFQL